MRIPEDFVGEYSIHSVVALRSSVLQRRLRILSLRSYEPIPVELSQRTRVASSEVALQLCYEQSVSVLQRRLGTSSNRFAAPRIARAQVRTGLKAVTFVSVVTQEREQTEHEANISPFCKRVEKACGRDENWTLQFPPWRSHRSKSSGLGKGSAEPR